MTRPGRHRIRILAAVAGVLAILVPALPVDSAPTEPALGESGPPRPKPFDLPPELRSSFDAIYDLVPASSCLTVSVGGADLYRRNGDQPVVPASTQKLLTGVMALDVLGTTATFETSVVSTAPSIDGSIAGDLHLVGGGDPLLATGRVIEARGLESLSPTRLDDLADAVVAAGVDRIDGRIIGDESRYDSERWVSTWPERFVDQEQSGPLSALTVDDGYDWSFGDGGGRRSRSADPPASAAEALRALLVERGVEVTGGSAAGPAPDGPAIASIRSAPLGAIVDEMLVMSDNQTAELLLKEIGHHRGKGGTTAGGLDVVRERAEELGLLSPATILLDGSGLDPENRATCDQLVRVLDHAGGPDSAIGRGLPIAGETGTLRNRFHGTAAEGKLRAKTGRLDGVSSLAGYVPLASGETATFGFVVNDTADEAVAQAAQLLMAVVVAGTELPCSGGSGPLLLGADLAIGSVGTLSTFPLQAVMIPTSAVPLQVFEDRHVSMVDTCLAADEDFDVVIVERAIRVDPPPP